MTRRRPRKRGGRGTTLVDLLVLGALRYAWVTKRLKRLDRWVPVFRAFSRAQRRAFEEPLGDRAELIA